MVGDEGLLVRAVSRAAALVGEASAGRVGQAQHRAAPDPHASSRRRPARRPGPERGDDRCPRGRASSVWRVKMMCTRRLGEGLHMPPSMSRGPRTCRLPTSHRATLPELSGSRGQPGSLPRTAAGPDSWIPIAPDDSRAPGRSALISMKFLNHLGESASRSSSVRRARPHLQRS